MVFVVVASQIFISNSMSKRMAELRKKDRKWLTDIARLCMPNIDLVFPGISVDHLPDAPARRLRKMRLINTYTPYNPAHHDRWIITDKGHTTLAAGP